MIFLVMEMKTPPQTNRKNGNNKENGQRVLPDMETELITGKDGDAANTNNHHKTNGDAIDNRVDRNDESVDLNAGNESDDGLLVKLDDQVRYNLR